MTHDANSSERRRMMEARAAFVREHLIAGLDALRERKRELLDPAEEIRRHPATAILAGAGLGLLLSGGAAIAGYRITTRERRARQARRDAWALLLTRPELVVRRHRSVARQLLGNAVVAVIAAVIAASATRRGARALRP